MPSTAWATSSATPPGPTRWWRRCASGAFPPSRATYDEGVGVGSEDCGCAYQTEEDERRGAESIAFTNDVISAENRRYLRGLPRQQRLVLRAPRDEEAEPLEVLLVHGSPRRISEYLFEERPDRSYLRTMEAEDADVLCFGHTHKPFHKALRYSVKRGHCFRHAINLGSVGKPKDGDPRACYALLHLGPEAPAQSPDRAKVEHVRSSTMSSERPPPPKKARSPMPSPRCCVKPVDASGRAA